MTTALLQPAQNPSSIHAARPSRTLVLVVDDEPKNLQLMGALLGEKGFEIAFAQDGAKALDLAARDRPDVILLDVMMPGMDGYEVCARLRQDPATARIPVIFLTAKTGPADILRGFRQGGVDYVTKPFHAEELLARAQAHAQLKKARETLIEANCQLVKKQREILRHQKSLAEKAASLARANRSLREDSRHLKQLNENRSEMLGIAAHDLKNPLSQLSGFISLLLESGEDGAFEKTLSAGENREILEKMEQTVENMVEAIKELLHAEKIEAGRLPLFLRREDIGAVMDEALALNQSQAAAKKITLIPRKQPHLEAEADWRRMIEILDNLIGNAIKFSPPDKRIWIEAAKTNGDPEHIRLAVRDEGPGLTDEDMEKVFGKFQKLSARPTAGEHSTGLGLSIVKSLAELHHGRVWAERLPRGGAAFILEFPVRQPPPAEDSSGTGET